MSKEEFLTTLANKLQEGMTSSQIEEQIRYYSGYIDGETARGRLESEVLAELGDPVLLARTLLDAKGAKEYIPEEQPVQREEKSGFYHGSFSTGSCLPLVLTAAAVICILLWLVGSIFRILSPILVPLLLIAILVSLWKKR